MSTFKLSKLPDRGEIGIASWLDPNHTGETDRPTEKIASKKLDLWSPTGETSKTPISSNIGMNNPEFK